MKKKTSASVIYEFFNSFGIPAYPVSSVPDAVKAPYLTYELQTTTFEMGEVQISVNLWYYTPKEEEINAKVQEISDKLGLSGAVLWCDNGAVWLKRGHPFSQAIRDQDDPYAKRRYLIINAEFETI